MPQSAPYMLERFQNSASRTTGPNVAPKPAHANETMRNTELFGSRARKTAMTAMTTSVARATRSFFFSSILMWRISPKMFSETPDAAVSSWESEVDIVAARMPARMTPQSRAASTPCWLIRSAMRTMMVSESEPSSAPSAPTLVSALPMMPIRIATPMAMTTQTVATRRDSLSLFSSSIAIKRSRMCGIPK